MERVRAVIRRLLFPGRGWVLLFTLLGGGALALTFLVLGETHPFAYLAYPLSAYGLTVLTAAAVGAGRRARQFLHRLPLAHRYLTDRCFQARASLLLSFFVNLCYAGYRLCCAVWYASPWDGALAAYNLLLCVLRLFLFRRLPGGTGDPDPVRALRGCRAAGLLLAALDLPLWVIAAQIVGDGRGYDYPGTLIYAAALHAFYSLGLAAAGAVRSRRYRSPILSAAGAVNLSAALVSLFSLETAMLARFGGDDAAFRLMMTGCTALAVCTLVMALAVLLAVSAHQKLRAYAKAPPAPP